MTPADTEFMSLSIIPLRLMQIAEYINSFVLFLSSIPWYEYTIHPWLFNHSPTECNLSCLQYFSITNKAYINICVEVFT